MEENISTLALFRCTEKQYAESFCKRGNMKFNTPKYWIDIEKEEGKGRGDISEGVYALNHFLDVNNLFISRNARQNVQCETIYIS